MSNTMEIFGPEYARLALPAGAVLVSLDGVPCEILRVNGIFRGVAVPAGVHDIVFTYRPASLYLGIGIALFGAALLVGSLLAAAWQRS